MMRPSLDQYLMGLAMVASKRTTCIKRAVGCVLADAKGHVLSIGYNGVASGRPHCNEVSENGFVVPLTNRKTPDGLLAQMLEEMPHVRPEQVMWFSVAQYADTIRPTGRCLKFGWAQHACEGHGLPSGKDSCEAVHAEQNALLQCRDVDRIRTAYVTLSPCKPCMKLLLNTPCERIVFHEEHTDPWPGEQWRKAGRAWDWLTE
jgi:deoxycytidylate deaminase